MIGIVNAFVVSGAILVASNAPPTVDIHRTCDASTSELRRLFGDQTIASTESCVKQQMDALEKIKTDWSSYPASDRSRCIRPEEFLPSYVEWLTCLEMEKEVRRIRGRDPTSEKKGKR